MRRSLIAVLLAAGCSSSPAPTTSTVNNPYQPADIVDASFEAGWDGFVNLSGGPPDGAVARDSATAKDSTIALAFSWNGNTGDQGAQVAYDLRGKPGHLWARTWFHVTAWPNGDGFKFFRMQDAAISGSVLGLQVLNGRFILVTPKGSIVYLGNSLPTLNEWHSVEWEADYVNHLFSFWVDEVLQESNFSMWWDAGDHPTWSAGVIDYKTNNGLTYPGYLDVVRVINPTTNAGTAYFDRVAVSTVGRIGP